MRDYPEGVDVHRHCKKNFSVLSCIGKRTREVSYYPTSDHK